MSDYWRSQILWINTILAAAFVLTLAVTDWGVERSYPPVPEWKQLITSIGILGWFVVNLLAAALPRKDEP